YDRGVTDNFDLVQAELELAQARSNSVLAKIDRTLAAAAIRRATGTLLDAFPGAGPKASETPVDGVSPAPVEGGGVEADREPVGGEIVARSDAGGERDGSPP